MSSLKVLAPVEQTTMDLFGEKIPVVVVQEGEETEAYVPLAILCSVLGINWDGESARVEEDGFLSESVRYVTVSLSGADEWPLLCFPQRYIYGWLLGIDLTQVKAELQPAVHQVLQESNQILGIVFKDYWFITDDFEPPEQPSFDDSELAELYREYLAIKKLAEYQMLMIVSPEQAKRKLELLGLLNRPGEFITFDQQLLVSQAVTDIILRAQDDGDLMGQVSFFQELHRRFNIWNYAQIPAARFDEVMSWIKTGC